jgi:hypothetical protein
MPQSASLRPLNRSGKRIFGILNIIEAAAESIVEAALL